ncbi:LCP family protein [Candidatus Woesebacteria bacterium]|nr:LCP family protein [Candidatus Woesebacteria bacterium]
MNQDTQEVKASSIFLKATLLSLLFAFIMLFLTAVGVGIWAFGKLNNFTKMADTSVNELQTIVQTGLNKEVTQTNDKKNILILGLDSLEARPDSPPLTDTIIIASIDLKSGQISTLSLPRDLWSKEYITRINALYYYGKERYPDHPEKFPTEAIEQLTGVKIHHTITVSMDSVSEIIDLLGGITVDVEHGFTDTQFPDPSVDVNKVSDPKILYQTITFEKGVQSMSGEKALQYIRSRKSGDDEGDDVARSSRQQIVIRSMIEKVKNLNPIKDNKMLAELYKYYNQNYASLFPIDEGIATLKLLYPLKENINLVSNTLSVYPDDQNGVIVNPPTYKYKGEWVYEIINEEKFKTEVLKKLNLL